MTETKEYLLSEIKKRHDRAQALVELADSENRDNTEEETTEIKSLMTRITEHQVDVKRMEDREALQDQLRAIGTVAEVATAESVEVAAKSIGEAFVKSSDYQAVVKQAQESGFPEFKLPTIELKAAGDPILEQTGDNATAIAPTWFGLETPSLVQYPLVVQAILNIVQLQTGNTANYPVVATRSITDQTSTAEAENKAGADFTFDYVTKVVEKWTAFGGASEEMFQDAPTITNYINTELGVMALQKEEAAILGALYTASTTAADGSGIGGLAGYDAVLEAMTLVRVAGGNPNAVLINPMDWARLAATRSNVAGDGLYYSGGPYAAPRENLWGGLREVQTPRVPEGTALVGDFTRGCRLFRKGGLRVDSSNSHDDYFRKNLIAIRAEVRSILGVTYPEFFVEVEIGS